MLRGFVSRFLSGSDRMGGGRKTRTITVQEKSAPTWTVNCTPQTARNLRKSDLGGVVFGCKHNTIRECFYNQLFGLPAPHYSYVKNIDPGLPLFLFNYSDRKLHGIYEAVSRGQLNINQHVWTKDGSDSTPYPAQVKFQIRMQCQPLVEDLFSPIIAENYYQPKYFWFELDRHQANKLISLFSSKPVPASTSFSKHALKDKSNTEQDYRDNPGLGGGRKILKDRISGHAKENHRKEAECQYPKCNQSYSSISKGMTTSVSQKTWSDLLKNETAFDGHRDESSIEWTSRDYLGLSQERKLLEARINQNAAENDKQEAVCQYGNIDQSSSSMMGGFNSSPSQKHQHAVFKDETASKAKKETKDLNLPDMETSSYNFDKSGVDWESASFMDGKIQLLEAPTDEENLSLTTVDYRKDTNEFKTTTDNYKREWSSSGFDGESQSFEPPIVEDETGQECKTSCECSLYSTMMKEMVVEDGHRKDVEVYSREGMLLEMKSSDLCSMLAKLLLEVEELKSSQSLQVRRIGSLEKNLVQSKIEIQQLKDQCKLLAPRPFEATGSEAEEFKLIDKAYSDLDGRVLIAGGFDGSSSLSDLCSYSLSQDIMKSLSSMCSARLFASAAILNGEIYIFGGLNGNLWYDTVESYNPRRNRWTSYPSLNQRKGNLAGISLDGKIFAIGGGNGVECFSEVEMFDPGAGRWIPCRSMLHKRVASAVAEINGILYVAGGCDGKDYLNSVERFDPREHSWRRLKSMTTKRGCHSLAVLNNRLYAMGGHNEDNMIPTVEVFDPHVGLWMMGESMNDSRGYFGSAVIGDAIYAFGGLNNKDNVLDMVECYREGHGWQVTDCKAIGKRCSFAAGVL